MVLIQRSSFLIQSFSPDQVSSTAQTLMSTNPSGNASERSMSSVMSVGTLDAFFGHDTQTTALLLIAVRRRSNSDFRDFCRSTKGCRVSSPEACRNIRRVLDS